MKPLTVLLIVLVAVAAVQLIAPGAGYHWFSSDFAPSGWAYGDRFKYLLTEAVPVLAFIVIGVLFWVLGRRTRADLVKLETANDTEVAD
jgi:glutamate:GABA antiporter